MRRYKKLYKKARKIMGNKTPLKTDCGVLCDGACCKGDEKTGMLLFPHEESSLNITEKEGVRLAVCQGHCNREDRPLSCIIFPFFPYINEKGRVEVKIDVRGRGICPMVGNEEKIKFDRGFLYRVKKLGRFLAEERECRAFMEEISREMDLIM